MGHCVGRAVESSSYSVVDLIDPMSSEGMCRGVGHLSTLRFPRRLVGRPPGVNHAVVKSRGVFPDVFGCAIM